MTAFEPNRRRLIEIIKRDALEYGDFTLKSGKKSNWYLDCRRVTLSPEGLSLIVDCLYALLWGADFDVIGGPCVGADPIVGAYVVQHDVRGCLIRKEEKDHGKADLVIGPVKAGDRVVIVEDVTTTGGSLMRAVDIVQAMGCSVIQAISVVDRMEGAADLFSKASIPFTSLVSRETLGLPANQ